MRHQVYGRKLSRSTNARRMLLRNLARDLIIRDRIRTTYTKARAVQPLVEHLVTLVKRDSNAGMTEIRKVISDANVVRLLVADAKQRFASRTGGYTRIIRIGYRPGDAAEEVLLSFVGERTAPAPMALRTGKAVQKAGVKPARRAAVVRSAPSKKATPVKRTKKPARKKT